MKAALKPIPAKAKDNEAPTISIVNPA